MLLKVAQYPITCQKGLEYWTKMGHLKCLEKSSKTNQVKHRPGKPVVGDSTSLVNLGTAKYQVLTVYILHWGTLKNDEFFIRDKLSSAQLISPKGGFGGRQAKKILSIFLKI